MEKRQFIAAILSLWMALVALSQTGYAQTPPSLTWQKALGGLSSDIAYAITASSDGGYVVAGETYSIDGDVTEGYHGSGDYWVVKLDGAGNKIWQKALGGSQYEVAYAITTSPDGGYVVAGYTLSNDGDVSGNHNQADFWVVKLDGAGNKVWQKALGGTGYEVATAITASGDGGYVVAGYTNSNDGDVTGTQGKVDYWVVKLDGAGNKVWQKALGGSDSDVAYAITASGDGGFVVAGETSSYDGDVSGQHGGTDYWVVKLDGAGNKVWQKALGGSNSDVARAITASGDGGFVVAGTTFTFNTDGDVSGNHGMYDYWVVKLDGAGNKVWQKALGGSDSDFATAITASPDGGFVVAGYTESNDGDVTDKHGWPDYWIVKLDEAGNKVWQKALGGSGSDYATAITPSADKGFVVAGYTYSTDGDVTGAHGNADYWVVKLNTTSPTLSGLSASPNPVCAGHSVQFTATVGDVNGSYTYTLDNGAGSSLSGTASGTAFSQNLTAAGSGSQTYTLTITASGGTASDDVTIIVNPLPTPSITGLATAYCRDASALTLTATPSGGSFTIDGNSANQLDPASLTAGSHMVRYTLTVNGCTAFTDQSVDMKALPDASFTGLAGPYCADASAVTLTPTTPGGTFGGPGVVGTTFTPSQAGSGGTITYTVTVNGCTNTTSQNVQIKTLPNASFSGLAGPYCADAAAVTLTPTIPGGTFGGPGVSGNTFTPANAGTGGSITYTVTVNSCTNTTSQNVQIKTLPNASFTGLSGPYCADASAVTLMPTTPGGTFGGPGVAGTTFTPANAGTGGRITYTLTVNGCTSSSSQNVTVKPLPDASFSGLTSTYCADAAAVTLMPTIPGGTFGGPGVAGTTFTPANAGSGGSITYTLTVNGCTSSSSQNVTVKPLPDASFSGLTSTYCADAAAVTLMPTIPGGTFGGLGVSGTTFTPANAGSGGTITYTLTVNGCTSSSSQNVTVKPLPDASFSGLTSTYCADAAAVTLTPTTPGGTFSGPGVSGNTFTPANAGTGGSIIYSITVNGCTSSSSQNVTVKPLPDASFTGLAGPYCADAAAVTLMPTTPGGTFGGPGVAGTTFTPANAGTGGSILYSVTVNGCTSSSSQNVTVKPLPDASFSGLAGPYCADAAAVTLTPTIPGGTFGGPGVSGNTFTPANAGTGGSITYTVTVNSCTNTTSQNVQIKTLPNASFTGLSGPYCADASAVTLMPTTPGGTFGGPGVSGNTFTPANAGTGGSIIYSITVNGCTSSSSQNVTVKPLPDASFTGLAGPYCADAAAVTLTPTTPGGTFSGPGVSGNTFTPASAGSGGTIQYTLTVNGCSNSSTHNVTVKPVPNASFTGLAGPYCANEAAVTLTPTTAGGTFSGPGVSGNTFTPANAGTGGTIKYTIVVDGCSNSSSQSVTVRPAISLTTSPNTTVVYGYGSNCTTLTASGGTGNIGLSWSTGASGGSVQVCPTQTTTYYVTATDAAGCSVQKAITVTVNDVRCGYGGVKMCQNGREACIAQYLVPTYQRFGYSLGSCNTSVSTRIGYEPQDNRTPSLALSVKAYPNPTSGTLNVEVYSPVATSAQFDILDAAGRPVQQRAVELSEGVNPATFELKAQPAGNYLIRCVDALGRQATVRVNKQ